MVHLLYILYQIQFMSICNVVVLLGMLVVTNETFCFILQVSAYFHVIIVEIIIIMIQF
jgi:hypothetical protein